MMTNKYLLRPMVILSFSLAFGIISGNLFPGHRGLSWLVMVICLLPVIRRVLYKKAAFFSLVILFFAYGHLSLQPYVSPEFPPNHVIHYADGHKWIITGRIAEKPIKDEDRLKFVLHVEKLGKRTPVTGDIRVTLGEQPSEELSAGDKVSFVSRIKRIRNFGNPGSFDYEGYMAFRKLWATASVYGALTGLFEVLERGKIGGLERFRREISDLIEETGPGKHVGVLKALIIGDKSEISEEMREDFSHAGIAHLLAISGLHVGIIVGVAFALFRWVFSRFKSLDWQLISKKGAAVVSLFPTVGYGLLAGMSDSLLTPTAIIATVIFLVPFGLVFFCGLPNPSLWHTLTEKKRGLAILCWFPALGYALFVGTSVSTSTQRAVIMSVVFLMAFQFDDEENIPMNTLASAAMLILLIHPPSLFSISFQLSFASVFSIIYGHSKIYGSKSMEDHQIRKEQKGIFSFFLVSLFATLGALPFIMLCYNNVTLTGLFANFIFIPVIGFVVVPLGLIAVCLYPFSQQLASMSIHVSAFVMANTIETITPTYLEISGCYILLWAGLQLVTIPSDTSEADDHSRRRRAKAVATCVILLFAADAGYWLHERFWHDDLRVTVIDVGQGSSALVETPGGACFLMDGGGFPDRSKFDVGENIVGPFLLSKRIKTVDAILLSHPDSDHLNGLLHIVRNFNVREVRTSGDESDSPTYHEWMKIIRKNHIPCLGIGEIWRIPDEINGVRVEVLYPPPSFNDRNETWRKRKNNNSLVAKVTFGDTSFLFPGDIEAEAEAELVTMAGDRLKSAVLIAPHHGSRTSSSERFLDAVDPEYIIISAGTGGRFPHPSVMERYERRGCEIYQTAESGAVSMSTDGHRLGITTHSGSGL